MIRLGKPTMPRPEDPTPLDHRGHHEPPDPSHPRRVAQALLDSVGLTRQELIDILNSTPKSVPLGEPERPNRSIGKAHWK